MKEAAAKTTKPSKSPSDFDGRLVALQLLDTTWRVALPILLLSWLGFKLDQHWHTKPIFILIGFFVSLIMAFLLVYRQVKSAYPDFFKPQKDNK